jgi:creatinine amidohydrolase
MLLMEQTWPDVRAYLERCRTIIIPLGSVEQHGLALPLGTDAFIAQAMSQEAGQRTQRLVAPMLAPGMSLYVHMDFPGTISFMPNTYTAMIRDCVASLHRHGFRNFLLVNGHGGNEGCIQNAMAEMGYRLPGMKYTWAQWWRMPEINAREDEMGLGRVGHGGGSEAALIMHVRSCLAKPELFGRDMKEARFRTSQDLVRTHVTETGIIDAQQENATAEIGASLFELAVTRLTAMLADLESPT